MKSLKQVEEITSIKADNLRQRIRRKTLKAFKKGRDWFISETELVKLIGSLMSKQKNGWTKELRLEKTWIDDLHPADILNKHIFPQIAKAQQEAYQRGREEKNENSFTSIR